MIPEVVTKFGHKIQQIKFVVKMVCILKSLFLLNDEHHMILTALS